MFNTVINIYGERPESYQAMVSECSERKNEKKV